jgi:hypothetical protein
MVPHDLVMGCHVTTLQSSWQVVKLYDSMEVEPATFGRG